ncbi:hypothetical protein TNCV_2497771 [Trichonephila clavipes]|nr:hypothetical protein TNCV_2497771 [Trichonephila clavipes]
MRRESPNKGLPDQEARYTLLHQLPSSRPHGQLQEAYSLTVSSNHSASTRATELYREPHLRRQEHPSTGLIVSSTPVMTSPPSHVPHVR